MSTAVRTPRTTSGVSPLAAIGSLITDGQNLIASQVSDQSVAQRLLDLLDQIDGCAASALLAAA
jgi:hypothetical protein